MDEIKDIISAVVKAYNPEAKPGAPSARVQAARKAYDSNYPSAACHNAFGSPFTPDFHNQRVEKTEAELLKMLEEAVSCGVPSELASFESTESVKKLLEKLCVNLSLDDIDLLKSIPEADV